MIEVERLERNAVGITLPRKVEAGDFPAMAPELDALIAEHGGLRVVLDISALRGWAGWRALKEHVDFVRGHQRKVQRMAVIAGPAWQWGLARCMRLVLAPRVRVFGREDIDAARRWLQGPAQTE